MVLPCSQLKVPAQLAQRLVLSRGAVSYMPMTTTARPWQSSVRVQHVRAQHVAMATQQFANPAAVQVHANAPYAIGPVQQISGIQTDWHGEWGDHFSRKVGC